MKKNYFIMLLACLSIACSRSMQVGIQIGQNMTYRLITPDSSYAVIPDSSGLALIIFPEHSRPGYGSLQQGRLKLPLYFNGKSFDMVVKADKKSLHADFSGKGAEINRYLNDTLLRNWKPNYRLMEEPFVAMMDSTENAFKQKLEAHGFDREFTRKEKQRIHYLVQGEYPMYFDMYLYYTCRIADPTERYYKGMKNLLIEDETLLDVAEYKNTLYGATTMLALKESNLQSRTTFQTLQARLSSIERHFRNPAIISYMTDRAISSYVESKGMVHQDYFGPIYNKNVLDAKAKKRFNAMCEKWAVIAPGQPSPAFCFADVDDKPTCLKDLVGKYVYIDMWATWCGPCRAEFPALYKLEHQFKNKDIHFVSISTDENRAAWKQLVREDKMPGIQLNINGDSEFKNAYFINAIPRFILLDKEGKIINADMTRPSDPKTSEFLDQLLK